VNRRKAVVEPGMWLFGHDGDFTAAAARGPVAR
jgi:hypothetical protein